MQYYFLLFAIVALLGAVYMSRYGFVVLRNSGLDNSIRVARWLVSMNVVLALLLAPTAIALHFMMQLYFNIPVVCSWFIFGLVNPILLFAVVNLFIKFLAAFRSCPSRFWIFSTISGILFGWSAWLSLSYLFLSDLFFI